MDLVSHMKSTSHTNFIPINDKTKLQIKNISFCQNFNKLVIKKWKRLVKDGEITEVKYEEPRKCIKCGILLEDAIDMFKHIKDVHIENKVKSSVSAIRKETEEKGDENIEKAEVMGDENHPSFIIGLNQTMKTESNVKSKLTEMFTMYSENQSPIKQESDFESLEDMADTFANKEYQKLEYPLKYEEKTCNYATKENEIVTDENVIFGIKKRSKWIKDLTQNQLDSQSTMKQNYSQPNTDPPSKPTIQPSDFLSPHPPLPSNPPTTPSCTPTIHHMDDNIKKVVPLKSQSRDPPPPIVSLTTMTPPDLYSYKASFQSEYEARTSGYQASEKGDLTRHQKAIHERKKYQCMECDYQATSKCNLTQHQEAIHEGRKYQCRECDYKATTKYKLTIHHQSIHDGKKYHCRECDYKATTKYLLTTHNQSIHEGKKYQCME